MDWARLQMEIDRKLAWMLFWSLIATLISLWVGYELLKAAIKNGTTGGAVRLPLGAGQG